MDHDDFQPPEPIEGLPEVPPEGEHILWQGKPEWWALANEALMLRWVAVYQKDLLQLTHASRLRVDQRWVAVYFAFLALWRGLAVGASDTERGIAAAIWLLGIGAVACGLIALFAWVQARATVYTVTNRRIVMRIGAALTLALNLPYRWIARADMQTRGSTGTITFDLLGETRFSYLVCWPHVRPWHLSRTQPAFRCIPDAETVSRLIARHAQVAVDEHKAQGETAAHVPAE